MKKKKRKKNVAKNIYFILYIYIYFFNKNSVYNNKNDFIWGLGIGDLGIC